MRKLITLILSTLPAWGAACTLSSGTYLSLAASAGHWTGTGCTGGSFAPGAVDTATISSGAKLSISTGETWPIGGSPGSNTVGLNITGSGSQLNLDGGTVQMLAGAQVASGGTINGTVNGGTFQFDPPSGVTYTLISSGSSTTTGINSSATSWSAPTIFETKSGAAGSSGDLIMNAGYASVNLSYTILRRLGTTSRQSLRTRGSFTTFHVLCDTCGQVTWGTPADSGVYNLDLDYFDTRNTPDISNGNGSMFLFLTPSSPSTSTIRRINHSIMTQQPSTGRETVYSLVSDIVIQNSLIFGQIQLINGSNMTMTNVALSSRNDGQRYVQIKPYSNFNVNGAAVIQHPGNAAGGGNYTFTDSGTNGTAGPNVIQNVVLDGSGTSTNSDFYLPQAEHHLQQIIATAKFGNIDDGIGGDTNLYADHLTLHDSGGAGFPGTINFVLSETTVASAVKVREIKNTICTTSQYSCVVVGGIWNPQTDFYYDYNGFWDIGSVSATPNAWNPVLGRSTGLSLYNPATRGTGTVSTVTDSTHITLGSLPAGTAVGDYVVDLVDNFQKYALITSISGNNLTLGLNNYGAQGITTANGRTITVAKPYWASGLYGDDGKGAHEIYSDPRYVDNTATVLTWDASLGGDGTLDHAQREMIKRNGWDIDGVAAVWNSNYSWENFMAYMRQRFTPQNPAYWCSGLDGDSRGGVLFCGRGKAMIAAIQ